MIVDEFMPQVTDNPTDNQKQNSDLAFCLIGEFLLSSGKPGFADVQIAEIVQKVRDKQSLVPLLLAETFHGLDVLSKG